MAAQTSNLTSVTKKQTAFSIAAPMTIWAPRLFSLVIGLWILGLGQAAMALQKGDQGNDVVALQSQLRQAGCYSGPENGNFYEMTEAGVMTCQQKLGLSVDGVAGRQTLNALAQYLGDDRPFGGRANPTASNSYGVSSTAGYNPDSLNYDRPSLLQQGSEGNSVVRAQNLLYNLGYYRGSIDGIYGPQTAAAVRRFQQDQQLTVTGMLDSQDIATLEQTPARPNPIASRPIDGWGGSFTQGSNRTAVGLLPQRPSTPNARYVVIVPKESGDTLNRVRRVLPGAQEFSSRKGDYIAAGTYTNRDNAEKRSKYLRSVGLDARVDYQ